MYALLISPNSDERALLSLVLQRAGLAVTLAGDLDRALKTWVSRPADLVLAATRGDPVAQVRRIRAVSEVPLIVVLDQADEDAHYNLLELGADLVVIRPYAARLLIAQARALLRRSGTVPLTSLPTLSMAGLTLDPGARTVQATGRPPLRLTHLEFRLLYTLMIHRGQILAPEVIVERVWGHSAHGDKELVRGLVSRLRGKLEPEPRSPAYIFTLPGVGYSFDPKETP